MQTKMVQEFEANLIPRTSIGNSRRIKWI
jgi:hypothetical protein